jgi:hypothetical protein
MFSYFLISEFPIVYISINSDHFNDENFEYYKSSYVNLLLKAKNEKQRMIILLDLIGCDNATFKMENILKQASFYKSIMEHSIKYVQHVYIISNRNDLHVLIKIFKTFAKSLVPYKVVRNTEKIEQNIYKKYNIKLKLNQFKSENIDQSKLISNYIYDKNCETSIEINVDNTNDNSMNIDINDINDIDDKSEEGSDENE